MPVYLILSVAVIIFKLLTVGLNCPSMLPFFFKEAFHQANSDGNELAETELSRNYNCQGTHNIIVCFMFCARLPGSRKCQEIFLRAFRLSCTAAHIQPCDLLKHFILHNKILQDNKALTFPWICAESLQIFVHSCMRFIQRSIHIVPSSGCASKAPNWHPSFPNASANFCLYIT